VNDSYVNSVAIGRNLTTNDPPISEELVVNTAVSTMSDVLGRKDHSTDAYVVPALPFGLAANHDWCVLGAIQIPVRGPHPYDVQLANALDSGSHAVLWLRNLVKDGLAQRFPPHHPGQV
jgi:hypothetical protein